jgi:hypothetical protein
MRHRSLFIISLVSLLLIFTLAGCGGGGGGHSASPEETAIRTTFSTANINAATILGAVSVPSAAGSPGVVKPQTTIGWSWDTTTLGVPTFSKVLANVVVDGATATATGTFTVSGTYTIGGLKTDGTTRWSSSGSYNLTGSGTITFVKVGDVWQINDVPGILLQSDVAKSPAISGFTRNPIPPATLNQGSSAYVGAVFTSQNVGFKRFVYSFKGFGGINTTVWTYTASPLNWGATINVAADATVGNNYGALAVVELVTVVADTTYELYFTSYISMVKVAAAPSM